MSGVEIRELECFLVLSEELHFGRAAERLYVSQSRVSQLLGALERRIGGRLLERTSRRVSLTPLGERFLTELRPAYEALRTAVDDARAQARGGLEGTLRVGFLGSADERVMDAIGTFHERHPRCAVALVEIPLADPFGAVRRGDVDAAIVCLPVTEPDLAVGAVFSQQPQLLAVPLRHPFAARPTLSAEELADCRLIGLRSPAPRYWREFMTPTTTPGGRPIAPGPLVCTLQEGLTAVAAGLGTMLLCAPTATHQGRRDVVFVPVTGLPESALALIWPHSRETAQHRALNQAIADGASTPPATPTTAAPGPGPAAGSPAPRLSNSLPRPAPASTTPRTGPAATAPHRSTSVAPGPGPGASPHKDAGTSAGADRSAGTAPERRVPHTL